MAEHCINNEGETLQQWMAYCRSTRVEPPELGEGLTYGRLHPHPVTVNSLNRPELQAAAAAGPAPPQPQHAPNPKPPVGHLTPGPGCHMGGGLEQREGCTLDRDRMGQGE